MNETPTRFIIDSRTVLTMRVGQTAVVIEPQYTFDEYVSWRRHNPYQGETVIPIEYDREAFHAHPKGLADNAFTLAVWHRYYEEFIRSQDARDQQATQQDGLR